MHVFQHSVCNVTQRNATQRKSFYATKSVAYFFPRAQTSQQRLMRLLAALRKQTETTSIFYATQRRRRTRPIRAVITFVQPMAAWCVRNVAVAAALRLRYVALRHVALRNDGKCA